MKTLLLSDLNENELFKTDMFIYSRKYLTLYTNASFIRTDTWLKLKYCVPFILKTNIENMPFMKVLKCTEWNVNPFDNLKVSLIVEKADNLQYLEELCH